MTKNILITGSSSGFGELAVKTIAKKGHRVFATMRNAEGKNREKAEALKNWASENNTNVEVVEMDVTSDESVNNAVKQIGQVDVVLNNAGIGNFGVNESFSADDVRKIYDVNVFGPQRVNRAVLPQMRERKDGLIIQITSVLGRTTLPTLGHYCATKYAAEAMAESYNYELKSLGIDSVIVQPGGYPTDFLNNSMQPTEPEKHKEYGEFVEKIEKSFGEFFKSMEGPDAPNPQEIADAIAGLVEMPQGERPMRTTVGREKDGAEAINQVCEKVQGEILTGFGMN